MSLITRMLQQTAVYWPPGAVKFDSYGNPIVDDPEEIACRWEDRAEEFVDMGGTVRISRSVVYVGQDVEVGGLLMLGEVLDASAPGFPDDPRESANTFEIRDVGKLPNLRVTEYLRTVML